MHALIFAVTIVALAGLLAAAFGADDLAQLRGWWRRLDTGDAALLARAAAVPADPETLPPWRTAPWVTGTGEHPAVGTQPVCDCRGRRCRDHREGRDCGTTAMAERPAYWRRIPAGRHTTALAAARWLAGDWWQADLPVRLRRELGRLAGAGTIPAGVS